MASTGYDIDFYLNIDYSIENIATILQSGKILGFRYWQAFKYSNLSVYKAAEELYIADHKDYYNHSINIGFKDTHLALMAHYNKEKQLDIFFFSFNQSWEKDFEIGL